MCQLLGMNCNTPTDIIFSFEGFSKRGGLTDHHTDGFGIGFFEGRGMRLFLDNHPSAQSPVAELVRKRHRPYPQSLTRQNHTGKYSPLSTRIMG